MNKIINYIKTVGVALSLLLFSGCEKDFLDINVDPNNPAVVPLSQILPYAQLSMTNGLGFGNEGLSFPASGFVHQTVTRDNYNNYFVAGDDFQLTQAWDNLYSITLTDLSQVIQLGTQQNAWRYVGIAQILKAYTFSAMVDVWGDIPFSQANLGVENPYPAFESGETIYPQLFTMIDEGIANLAKETTVNPGAADLFYGGNVARWRRFANTLKLKLYNQVRLTNLYDAAAVSALIAGGDLMAAGADDFEMQYGNLLSPDNRHPAFIQEYTEGAPNWFISPYFYEIMRGTSTLNPVLSGIADPRIPYYFYNQLGPTQDPQNPTAYFDEDTRFLSIWFGSLNVDPNEGFDQNTSQTVAGLYPAGGKYDNGQGGAAGPTSGVQGAGVQRLFTYASSLYTRAELALTKATGENDAALFETAVRESFAEVNRIATAAGAPLITAANIDAYVTSVLALYTAGSADKKLELIMTEKWIHNFGNAVESYTDYRRTGYPRAFDPATDNNPFTVANREYIVSFPYPVRDLQINPKAGREQRNIAADRVFWDK
jgi:hypothetical protein